MNTNKPSIDLRQMFLMTANILSFVGFSLNIYLFYLISYKTPKIMSAYKIILLQNWFVDFQFNIVNGIVKGQTDYKYGTFYIIGSDLLKILPYSFSASLLILWTFSLFCCVTTIPAQFFYRYFVIVQERNLTTFAYLMLVMVSFMTSFCLAGIWIYIELFETVALKDNYLLLENDQYYFQSVPFFLVAKMNQLPMQLNSALGYILVFASYGITLYCFLKVQIILKTRSNLFSSTTQRMHAQMTKTMILQAIIPLIFILIPVGSAITFGIILINIPGLGMVINSICCWIPVVNPLVTIITIKTYQKLTQLFFKKALKRCFTFFMFNIQLKRTS